MEGGSLGLRAKRRNYPARLTVPPPHPPITTPKFRTGGGWDPSHQGKTYSRVHYKAVSLDRAEGAWYRFSRHGGRVERSLWIKQVLGVGKNYAVLLRRLYHC